MTGWRLVKARASSEERCTVTGVGPGRWVGISVGGLSAVGKTVGRSMGPTAVRAMGCSGRGPCDRLTGMGDRAKGALNEIVGVSDSWVASQGSGRTSQVSIGCSLRNAGVRTSAWRYRVCLFSR